MTRKLSLKRETLQELTTDELHGVAGAAQTRQGLCETMFSCMTFISCNVVECLPTVKDPCVE
ncbi:MAG TPA: hypothetical protein VNA20_15160 [Frankiaceae bacterium]|nr:hypothetical protein [Frankiaceae bacterium]